MLKRTPKPSTHRQHTQASAPRPSRWRPRQPTASTPSSSSPLCSRPCSTRATQTQQSVGRQRRRCGRRCASCWSGGSRSRSPCGGGTCVHICAGVDSLGFCSFSRWSTDYLKTDDDSITFHYITNPGPPPRCPMPASCKATRAPRPAPASHSSSFHPTVRCLSASFTYVVCGCVTHTPPTQRITMYNPTSALPRSGARGPRGAPRRDRHPGPPRKRRTETSGIGSRWWW